MTQAQLEQECIQLELGQMASHAACRNYVLEKQLMIALAEKLKNEPVKDLTIVLVGDHKPIFLLEEERQLYSDKSVATLILSNH